MKYFIGGVARAYLFSGETMVMSSNTLINSSIEISTEAVDARGGDGNKLLGRYFHTGTLSINFEDAVFNLDYVARNVGALKTIGEHNIYNNEKVTLKVGGKGSVEGTPQPFIGSSLVGWAHPLDNAEATQTVNFSGHDFVFQGGDEGQEVCVMYPVEALHAEYIDIPVNIIPDTMHCTLITKLYRASGESMDLSSSSVVGTVTIEIPRLQFSGAQTISMSSTGVSTTPLTGNALSVDAGTCDGAGTYATFTVNLTEGNWYDKVIAIAPNDGDIQGLKAGDNYKLVIYAIAPSIAPSQIHDGLTYESDHTEYATVSDSGTITAVAAGTAEITVKITQKPEVKCVVKVTVEAA